MPSNKSISVKVSVVKVLKALEATLAQKEKEFAGQEANEAKFEKATEKWNKEIGVLATKYFSKAENVSVSTNYSGRINVDINLPAGTFVVPDEPKRDFNRVLDWKHNEVKEELENAIRILKMTDDLLVSASTFGQIAKYL